MKIQTIKEQINFLISHGEYDDIKSLLLSNKELTEHDNDLATICYLCTIYEKEKAAGQATIFSKVSNIEELLERYTCLKFYLRRIDFDILGGEDEWKEFYFFLSSNQVSSYELLTVIEFSVVNKDKVIKEIKGE